MQKKTLALLDASGYIYRAFHAIRPLTAPDGRPTNAIFQMCLLSIFPPVQTNDSTTPGEHRGGTGSMWMSAMCGTGS